jgi:hypothetical protein
MVQFIRVYQQLCITGSINVMFFMGSWILDLELDEYILGVHSAYNTTEETQLM